MEHDIVDGKIGEVGKYDIEFKEGALVIEVSAALGASSAGVLIKVDAAQVLDAIAKAIPGTIDDAILGVAKAALGK